MTTDEMIRGMYGDMQEMKSDMQGMKCDIKEIKVDVADLKDRVGVLEEKVDKNTQRLTAVEEKVDKNTQSIAALNLVVENQIGHAIKLIAENHCELNEKLNKIMKDQAYFNKIDVRLDVLESDVELLKKQVGA